MASDDGISSNFIILPFVFQATGISLSQWVNLLTLCLAPLNAHVASGAPTVSYLTETRPRWHDYICKYNPTSILWRYAAINDRRIRAKRWNEADLAASNAIFWTHKGWSGRESLASSTLPQCSRLPDRRRMQLLSWDMVKTAIVTLQGTQASYSLASGIAGTTEYNVLMGVDTIFYPLAMIGLLRLCAALWLTEDYGYVPRDHIHIQPLVKALESLSLNEEACRELDRAISSDPTREPLVTDEYSKDRFRSTTYLPSILFRLAFISTISGLVVLCVLYDVPLFGFTGSVNTVTSFIVGLFYFFFLGTTTLLYAYYFVCGGTRSTLIPCISSTWYKIYTLFVATFMVTMLVVAAFETKQTPCGKFTSAPGEKGDQYACQNLPTSIFAD